MYSLCDILYSVLCTLRSAVLVLCTRYPVPCTLHYNAYPFGAIAKLGAGFAQQRQSARISLKAGRGFLGQRQSLAGVPIGKRTLDEPLRWEKNIADTELTCAQLGLFNEKIDTVPLLLFSHPHLLQILFLPALTSTCPFAY